MDAWQTCKPARLQLSQYGYRDADIRQRSPRWLGDTFTLIQRTEAAKGKFDLAARIAAVQMGTVGAGSEEGAQETQEYIEELQAQAHGLLNPGEDDSELAYMVDPDAKPDIAGLRRISSPIEATVRTGDGSDATVPIAGTNVMGFTRVKAPTSAEATT